LKEFICSICNKQFYSAKALGGHIGSHNRGKNNSATTNCLYCNNIIIHHKNDKRFYCNTICQKKQSLIRKNLRKINIKGHILDITYGELEKYREKQKVCEICGNKEKVSTNSKGVPNNLSVDHNHNTKKFRGLLCYSCNIKVGWVENYYKELKNYLERDNFKF